jgi:NAD(P)H-quinone oxidoreductase subunit 5
MSLDLALIALIGPAALAAAAIAPMFGAVDPPKSMAARCLAAGMMALATALPVAATVVSQGPIFAPLVSVVGIGLSVYVDALSAILFVLVSFIGVVVLRYSRNYLDGDPRQSHFFNWLALTLASVLTLIVSGNVALLIAAWIATSLGLHKLLLFYPGRPAAQLAAKKKFVASRIGDLCLICAAWMLWSRLGSLELPNLIASARGLSAADHSLSAPALLIACAALLKSAQLPVHGWLIEVMETPTPVSALLHAGVINAGGFLVLRLADVVVSSGAAMKTLALVGGATALFGSVVMLTQTSVKVSLAYSTIAQMGFMMLECGLGAFPAALLHIVAHSLYKAHAFLSSGSIIDLARASWTPSPSGQPHPARYLLAIVATPLFALVVGAFFGATLIEKPGAIVLAAILLMGLAHLFANAWDERFNPYVLGKAAGMAVIVAVSFFALHAGMEVLLAHSVPQSAPLRGPIDAILAIVVILSFGAVTLFQSVMASHAKSDFWQAAYVHLSQGLYLNTLANRLMLRLWPRRAIAN